MGHHHCHLPEVNFLEEQFQRWGLEKFVKHYLKCDGWIGESDRITYIQNKIKLWQLTTSIAGGQKAGPTSH